MLEAITLGEIAAAVLFLVGFIGGVAALLAYYKKFTAKLIKDSIKEEAKPYLDEIHNDIKETKDKVDELQTSLIEVEKENAKNYITHFLSRLDEGRDFSQAEFECFFENLKTYEKCDGDGFIHAWIDRLEDEGAFNVAQRRSLGERRDKRKKH